jgi:glycogen operon protein
MKFEITLGRSFPLGSTVYPDGVNFCLFSKHATQVYLLLFDEPNAAAPIETIALEPDGNNTFHYWHIFVKGIKAGQVYAYRVDGPNAPEKGHRFDRNKVLLDPYTKAIAGDEIYDRQAAMSPGDNSAQALRSVVVDSSNYDWEGDYPLYHPYAKTVIYEMHVGGFTRHPNSGLPPEKRGTYAGVIEKIPYLKQLGITAVELLPIQFFDEKDAFSGLENYWGYSPIAFFAPHRAYSSRRDLLGPVEEFRDMVKALHQAGIEVILDVVFNHTAEGNEKGPTISFRGIDNRIYYILDQDRRTYCNFSGCGNTFRGNHPIVGHLVLESLRYWVSEMHVDGFRFDLASVLTRDAFGNPIDSRKTVTADLLWVIESDPVLAGTKLIAEAWDAAGLYQVGRFVELADWFSEWNGPFRDDVRCFVKSDRGMIKRLAARLLASPDIYHRQGIDINRSINFVTCHDGFTLNDLVSYNEKHNEANGELNQDGANDNFSWNCGAEGETTDPNINRLRLRQIKNFFTILFLAQGTPMILMGDEIRRTQQGNNNTYCQDNELNWFDWSAVEREREVLDFLKNLIHFSQNLVLYQQEQLLEVSYASQNPHLSWHGVRLGQPDWSEESRILAFSLRHYEADEYLHVMINAHWQPHQFELPLLGHGDRWHRIIDTALPAPEDFNPLAKAAAILSKTYQTEARSIAVLMVKATHL